jgi:hypothetical protein
MTPPPSQFGPPAGPAPGRSVPIMIMCYRMGLPAADSRPEADSSRVHWQRARLTRMNIGMISSIPASPVSQTGSSLVPQLGISRCVMMARAAAGCRGAGPGFRVRDRAVTDSWRA